MVGQVGGGIRRPVKGPHLPAYAALQLLPALKRRFPGRDYLDDLFRPRGAAVGCVALGQPRREQPDVLKLLLARPDQAFQRDPGRRWLVPHQLPGHS